RGPGVEHPLYAGAQAHGHATGLGEGGDTQPPSHPGAAGGRSHHQSRAGDRHSRRSDPGPPERAGLHQLGGRLFRRRARPAGQARRPAAGGARAGGALRHPLRRAQARPAAAVRSTGAGCPTAGRSSAAGRAAAAAPALRPQRPMRQWLPGWLAGPPAQPRVVARPPAQVLSLLFLGLILAGTLLLKLPFATTAPISWLDALFTAASAVTVTGLTVLDPGTAFTHYGHVVLLLLIQLGALGIITFATLILSLLGQRLGLRQQLLLRDDLNQTSLGDLARLARLIAAVVLLMEAAGTLLLAFRFVPLLGWSERLFQALFHAVSAFCNAGFSLLPDGLSGLGEDPLVSLAVSALIVVGGVGFNVLADLWQWRRSGFQRLSLHSHLTLAGTAMLLGAGFIVFLALGCSNPDTMGQDGSVFDRLLIARLQAVTQRSAGFASVDTSRLEDGTTLLMI